ncbi:DNA polymerase beta subunit [mine drainage metagenome]|uniref:DNA polymerase beta subunit n=1 Tax=mine drainage metagenome TaxID=410659 RepID=T0ZI19_9ZZZZ
MFLEMAKRKNEVFRNIDAYLESVKGVVQRVDPKGEIYLFGSVATGHYNMASDIDVLIVTHINRNLVQAELDSKNIGFLLNFI